MAWGIAETAPEIEKIKAESADYLGGLNSCGVIDYGTYSYAFDFYADLLDKAYEQGKQDAKAEKERKMIESDGGGGVNMSDAHLMIVIISAFTFGLTLGYKIGKG